MATGVILIGNSDNKLEQIVWSQYIAQVERLIHAFDVVHFSGFSDPRAPWQNACWVFEMASTIEADLTVALSKLANDFKQDSIALITGNSYLIPAVK